MNLTRRDFLKVSAVATAAEVLREVFGQITPVEAAANIPIRVKRTVEAGAASQSELEVIFNDASERLAENWQAPEFRRDAKFSSLPPFAPPLFATDAETTAYWAKTRGPQGDPKDPRNQFPREVYARVMAKDVPAWPADPIRPLKAAAVAFATSPEYNPGEPRFIIPEEGRWSYMYFPVGSNKALTEHTKVKKYAGKVGGVDQWVMEDPLQTWNKDMAVNLCSRSWYPDGATSPFDGKELKGPNVSFAIIPAQGGILSARVGPDTNSARVSVAFAIRKGAAELLSPTGEPMAVHMNTVIDTPVSAFLCIPTDENGSFETYHLEQRLANRRGDGAFHIPTKPEWYKGAFSPFLVLDVPIDNAPNTHFETLFRVGPDLMAASLLRVPVDDYLARGEKLTGVSFPPPKLATQTF